MEKQTLPDIDRCIIRSFARSCRQVVLYYHKNIITFFSYVVKTKLFYEFPDLLYFHSQGQHRIARKLLEEISIDIPNVDEKYWDSDGEVAYWIGYVLMWWLISTEGKELSMIQQVDFELLYWNYDVLHTTGVPYTIRFIKKEYIKNNINNKSNS